MTRYKSTSMATAILVYLATGALLAAAAQPPRNIILIGWDGAQRDHIKEMIARGELPNLVALSKEGTMVDIDVVSGATDTKAGWTQLLTGYTPGKTGVFSNARYQPIPVGYSIFERVEKHFGDDNIETRAMIGKKGHVDNDPPTTIPYEKWEKQQKKQKAIDKKKAGFGDIPGGVVTEENGVKVVKVPGKPWYNASQNMDMFVNGLRLNEAVGAMALKNLEECKDKRFLFFIHFAEPDHAGHQHGENSQEYTDALKSDDEWTGKIIAKLKELGIYDQTLVYVIADHGFNEGESGHRYAPYVFCASNDKAINRNGTREDIAATVLKRFGLDLTKVEPKLDGIPLDEPAPERKAPAEKPVTEPGKKAKAKKAKAKAAATGTTNG
ncbi:MAG: alkaline phosphatase family protein [Candidatus Sumerlaeia bacterium]|nr:alkaline phosphatase family protein [Candidatus Sumerlaeia bacterium]